MSMVGSAVMSLAAIVIGVVAINMRVSPTGLKQGTLGRGARLSGLNPAEPLKLS
jgi:hypothetical protein